MKFRDLIPLALALALPCATVYVAGRLSRWYAGRRDPIDELIAHNAALPRIGMESMDWSKTDRAGERQWQETLRAQRKARNKVRRPKNVIQMRKIS